MTYLNAAFLTIIAPIPPRPVSQSVPAAVRSPAPAPGLYQDRVEDIEDQPEVEQQRKSIHSEISVF